MGYNTLLLAIFNTSINSLNRERCGICNKPIFKHQQIVVCSVDGKIFDGACFGLIVTLVFISSQEQYLIGFVHIAHVIYFPFIMHF